MSLRVDEAGLHNPSFKTYDDSGSEATVPSEMPPGVKMAYITFSSLLLALTFGMQWFVFKERYRYCYCCNRRVDTSRFTIVGEYVGVRCGFPYGCAIKFKN